MEVGQDARTEQHLILSELREVAAQVQRHALPANAEALLTALQLALSDGLRNPDDGFWPAVSTAVHAETRRLVETTASPRRRGRAWLRVALAESSLGAHLRLLSREPNVRRAYKPGAAFTTRAPQLAALCDALPDLSLALANKPWDWRSSPVTSLPSPGDSGVAMTDSDREDDRRLRGNDVAIATVVTRRPKRRRCKAKRVSFHDEQATESMTESTTESTTESMTESTTESTVGSTSESMTESTTESDCTEALDEREERCDPEGQEDPALVDGVARTKQVRVDGAQQVNGTKDGNGAGNAKEVRVNGAQEIRVFGANKAKEVRVDGAQEVRVDVARRANGGQLAPLPLGVRPSRWGVVLRPSTFIVTETRDSDGNKALESEIRAALASADHSSADASADFEDHCSSLMDPGEMVYKTFRLHWSPCFVERSPLIGPVHLMLTNRRLCLSTAANHVTVELARLTEISVLPWQQGLLLASQGNDTMLLATGDEQRTNQLAAAVTMATLRAVGRFLPVGLVPLVAVSSEHQMPEASKERVERVWLVAVDDADSGSDVGHRQSPLGPATQGSLMVQSGPGAAWAPRYMTLKAGVLYEFESDSSRLPLRWHALAALVRCQRTLAGARPHAFMLRWANAEMRLAAADAQQASHWLDSIVAAANATEWEGPKEEAGLRWLSLTNHGQLFLRADAPFSRQGNGPTTQGDVATLHSLRLATEEPHSCQMEWGCREASQETSGDWLLHFASSNQAQAFVSAVSRQWQHHHKTVLPVGEMESCVLARCTLDSTWR